MHTTVMEELVEAADMTQVVKGSSVEVKSEGEWCDATVSKVRDHKIKVHYVGGKQEDEWIAWISGRLRLPKSTATGDFSRIDPQTRPANMKRHAAHCAAVHGVSRGEVSEGEAVKGIGAGGDAGGRPPVLDEGAVDVVGDKTKQHKGRSRLENIREELVEAADMSEVPRDKIVKKYCGTNASHRKTFVIALYDPDEQWFVGEVVFRPEEGKKRKRKRDESDEDQCMCFHVRTTTKEIDEEIDTRVEEFSKIYRLVQRDEKSISALQKAIDGKEFEIENIDMAHSVLALIKGDTNVEDERGAPCNLGKVNGNKRRSPRVRNQVKDNEEEQDGSGARATRRSKRRDSMQDEEEDAEEEEEQEQEQEQEEEEEEEAPPHSHQISSDGIDEDEDEDEDEDDGGAVVQTQIHGGQGQGVILCGFCDQRHHYRTICAAKQRRKKKKRTAPHGKRPADDEEDESSEERSVAGGGAATSRAVTNGLTQPLNRAEPLSRKLDPSGNRPVGVSGDKMDSDYHVAYIQIKHIDEMPSNSPWCHVVPDQNFNIFRVFMCVGRTLRITASDLASCHEANFKNLQQSIDASQSEQMELGSESNGEELSVKFVALPKNDKEASVEVTLVRGSEEIKSRILFMLTGYAEQPCVVAPGKTFTMEAVSVFHEYFHGFELLQSRKGEFSISAEHAADDLFTSDCKKWLNNTSGKLEVSLPKMIGSAKCTKEFRILRKNKFDVMAAYKLVIQFCTFSFENIPEELIKGQDISQPIRLTSKPVDMIKLSASIASIDDLKNHGFKIRLDNQIEGTPNAAMKSKNHAVEIMCHDLPVKVNLSLPRIEEWKPPQEIKDKMKITQFELDHMITNMKASQQKDFTFHEQVSDKKRVPLREDGCYELNLIIGVPFEAMLMFSKKKFSALDTIETDWKGKPEKDLFICVKEGCLSVSGTPQAHHDDGKLTFRIHKSSRRFRRTCLVVTPQNPLGGPGEKVKVIITCRPLKVFWGLAQTYDFKNMPEGLTKLKCCDKDLDVIFKDHMDLGYDILLSCRNTDIRSIEKARQQLVSLIKEVKTVDVVSYFTGHGYEKEDNKTHLLVKQRDDRGSEFAAWDTDAGNVCIQTELAHLEKAADSSTFLVLIIDACRTVPSPNGSVNGKNFPKRSDSVFKLEFERVLKKQVVLWWSTSFERIAMAGHENRDEMSPFTAYFHEALQTHAVNEKNELNPSRGASDERYFTGIPVIKDEVHRRFLDEHLLPESKKKDRNCRNLQPEHAQQPEYREIALREAFTFALPASHPLDNLNFP